MKSTRASMITALLICLLCSVSLHAQERSHADTVAIVNFGVNNPKYKAEAKRIPDTLRSILRGRDGVSVLGDDLVSESLMADSRVLDVFETDSAYWNTVGALTGAEVVVHGLVKPQNDTTIFVDLFVVDLAARRDYKTAFIYNPKVKANRELTDQLRRVVDDLILFGRTSGPVVMTEGEQGTATVAAAADSAAAPRPEVARPTDADEQASFRWLIGGAAIVAAAVTVFVLLADAVEPSDHNLPAPPSFP